jgi:hypothetical protein
MRTWSVQRFDVAKGVSLIRRSLIDSSRATFGVGYFRLVIEPKRQATSCDWYLAWVNATG